MRRDISHHQPDVILLGLILIMVIFGMIMIYSASAIVASQRYGNSFFFLEKQSLWVILGLVLMLIMIKTDYQKLQKYSRILIIITIISLFLVLTGIFGHEAGGAKRWIRMGPVGFQPSELAKIALIIYLADVIDRKQSKLKYFLKGLLPLLVIVSLVCLLVLIEPDFGTTACLGTVAIFLLFIGGVKWGYLLSLMSISVPAFSLLVVTKPYRVKRLLAFFDPWADPKGIGYQIIQSLIALGSGGLIGVGLGNSKQKLFYLPAPYTDFIFPIIGEELGFIGTIFILVIFVVFAWRGLKIAWHAPDLFGNLLAAGITFMIFLQALINIGVSCGFLPTKGLPLPFLSFGGSSLLFTLGSAGILLNISRHTTFENKK